MIEKRIRKYARLNKIFKKNDVILVKDDVSLHFIKRIIKNLPVKIVRKGKCNKIACMWTADDEINDFFTRMISKKYKSDKKNVKMFLLVTDDELEKYCRINGIQLARNKKDKAVMDLVDKISLKHPDSKHKLIKSFGRLQGL